MNGIVRIRLAAVAAFAFGAFALPGEAALAADGADVAIVFKTKGRVDVKKSDQNRWLESVGIGFRLNSADRVRAMDKSMAAIMFTDDRSLIKVQANTELEIQGEREEKFIAKKVELDLGGMFFNVARQKEPFEIITPTSVASVKGSIGFAAYSPGGPTIVSMLSGLAVITSTETGDTVSVGLGQTGQVSETGATSVGATTDEANSRLQSETSDMSVPEVEIEEAGGKEIVIEFKDEQGVIHRIRIPYSENR